jgi:hypothetical protein
MKKEKVIFWIATGLIFIFEGIMPALTSQTEFARAGIAHLGYPAYFGVLLAVFKVSGSLALIIPQVPARIKEWAYAGFGLEIISATVSNLAVDGVNGLLVASIIAFAVVATSYVYYHKLHRHITL